MSIMNVINRSSYDAMSEESCPDYDSAINSAHTSTFSTSRRWLPSVPSPPPFDDPISPSSARRLPRPLQRNERYVYTYSVIANTMPVDVLITVEPSTGGKYTFKLSIRVNKIERSLCEPVVLNLRIDPKQLEFVVFLLPGKTTILMGGLWCLRVWLRANEIEHKLFGEDEIWIGKDLDFTSVQDASIARHKVTNHREQVYHGFVGNALVNFTVKWRKTEYGTYKCSLDYEAGGVSSTLFDDLDMCFDHDPRTITFIIYTVKANAIPAGSSHKLRVWMRSPVQAGIDPGIAMAPYDGSFIYQRIWKTDSLKIGSRLDFGSLGPKVIMAFAKSGPETVMSTASPSLAPSLHSRTPSSTVKEKELGYLGHMYR